MTGETPDFRSLPDRQAQLFPQDHYLFNPILEMAAKTLKFTGKLSDRARFHVPRENYSWRNLLPRGRFLPSMLAALVFLAQRSRPFHEAGPRRKVAKTR